MKIAFGADMALWRSDREFTVEAATAGMKPVREIFDKCDFIVGDLSFISIVKILEYIKDFLTNQQLVLLIKPQFECGIELAKKYKGTIHDYNLSKKICNETLAKIKKLGFVVKNVADSQIKGGDGNSEFVALIEKK